RHALVQLLDFPGPEGVGTNRRGQGTTLDRGLALRFVRPAWSRNTTRCSWRRYHGVRSVLLAGIPDPRCLPKQGAWGWPREWGEGHARAGHRCPARGVALYLLRVAFRNASRRARLRQVWKGCSACRRVPDPGDVRSMPSSESCDRVVLRAVWGSVSR